MVKTLQLSKIKWLTITTVVFIGWNSSSPVWAQSEMNDAFSSALEQTTIQTDSTSSNSANEMTSLEMVDGTTNTMTKPETGMSGVVQPTNDVLNAPQPELQEMALSINEPTKPKAVPHSGQYYDSASIMPNAALGTSVGPREVDPKYEPGSSFVVVSRSAGANSFPARLVAGQRALKLGRYSSALEIYEGLYRKSPRNRQVLMGLAVAQQNGGFEQSAIATYEELLRVDPNNVDATVNMLGLIQKQYPAVAYRKLQELWDKNSQNPGIAAQLGLTSAKMGNAEDAIRYLGIASSLEPQNAMHLYNMAVVTDQIGAYKDALELYEHALEVDATYGGSRSVPRERVYDRLAHLRRL